MPLVEIDPNKDAPAESAIPKLNDKGRMADIPLSPAAKITVERRGEIVLIGVNRPQVYNRFDPPRRTTTSTTTRPCGRRRSSATARTSPGASTWTPSPFSVRIPIPIA
jgi:hypothetical protein